MQWTLIYESFLLLYITDIRIVSFCISEMENIDWNDWKLRARTSVVLEMKDV